MSELVENHKLIRRLIVLWLVFCVSSFVWLIHWVVYQVFKTPELLPKIITDPVASAISSVTGLLAVTVALLSGGVTLYKVLRYKEDMKDNQAGD